MERRKAVNLICKYYEFDAAKIAAAMEAESTEDNAALVRLLEGMIAELRELADGLLPSEPTRIIKPNPAKPVIRKVGRQKGRQPNPDRQDQARKNLFARRRSQLRKDGYIIATNSMIAYYDARTRRRWNTERNNKYGFKFLPKK